jgi:hypothetical protein
LIHAVTVAERAAPIISGGTPDGQCFLGLWKYGEATSAWPRQL